MPSLQQMSRVTPAIDVLLPAYNAEATIELAIRSLQAQTYSSWRALVIDDGSQDATSSILTRLASEDPRIEVLRTQNRGIVEALNLGLAQVRAPLVARHDADDISAPDRLERQAAMFAKHGHVVAVSGSCTHIDAAGRPLGTSFQPCDPAKASFDTLPATEPYLLHPFLMARRQALAAVGGYRHVVHAEDTDLYWRLREIGSLVNLDTALGQMRLHTASISNASVLNGRIMAVSSQLAALSARRRALGRDDIAFPASRAAEYRAARSLAAILEIANTGLDAFERRHLRLAATVKLLELATGRAYELETEDCRYARRVYADIAAEDLRGRSVANWAYRATLQRLVRSGRLARATSILDPLTVGRAALLRLM